MKFDFNLLNSIFFINILSLPSKGVLLLDGKEVRVGSKISKYDIQDKKLSYQHTSNINPLLPAETDNFTFCLWNNKLGNITPSSYPACTDPSIINSLPVDGVYVFNFTIEQFVLFELNYTSSIQMFNDQFYTLQVSDVDINFNGNIEPILYSVKPTGLEFFVRNQKTNTFTYTDVSSNQVKIKKTSSKDELLTVTACNSRSDCKNGNILFVSTTELEQIGNNIIYARAGQTVAWSFFANKDDVLWEIENGEIQDLITFTDRNIIQWSSFSDSANLSINDPGRGPGFNKLQMYQNIQEQFFKTDKLPTGLLFSNLGYLTFVMREPPSISGSQPWHFTNNLDQQYDFNLTAIDPTTGKRTTRKYRLVVNSTGTNINGLNSETLVL